MGKKHKGTRLRKFFPINFLLENKKWICILILMVGMAAIGRALYVDLCSQSGNRIIDWDWSPELRCKLWQASETVRDMLIAYSTMLAAVVIFYYSVTENKRLGVPYRRLIAYTVGPFTIPVLFVVTLLLTVFVVVAQPMSWKYTTYVCAIYILLLQTCMIVLILSSTSYEYGKRLICWVEKNDYRKKVNFELNGSISREYYAGHLEQALHSDEIIGDKKEFLQEFLRIPFQRKTWKKLSYKYSRSEVITGEESEKIYQFYFYNTSASFQNMDGEEKQIERNELYLCIGSFLKELCSWLRDGQDCNKDKKEDVYHTVLSGIINGMVYSEVEDKDMFCDYIFSECIPDGELSIRQLHLCVLFQEVMNMFDERLERRLLRIRKLMEWKILKINEDDILFYANFWDIWVKIFRVSQVEKLRHFEMAMQTMTGRSNKSQVIFEILLQAKEKE